MRYNTVKNILLAIAVLGAFPACASKPYNQDPQGSGFYDWHQEPLQQVEQFKTEIAGDYQRHNLIRPQVVGQSSGPLSQAGSFLSQARAERQAMFLKFQNTGASAWVQSALVGGKTYYRVLVNKACEGLRNQRGVGCFEVEGE